MADITYLAFSNPDVAKKYKSSFKGDPKVHLPGKKGTGFACKLSQVTLKQAEQLFNSPGQNLLELNDEEPNKLKTDLKNRQTDGPALTT